VVANSRILLIAQLNIPLDQRFDPLRLCPEWPAITAGGPRFLHSVRAFIVNNLPMFRSLDSGPWPFINPNKLNLLCFSRDMDVIMRHPPTPVHSPGLVAHPLVPGVLTGKPEFINKKNLQKQNTSNVSCNALITEYVRLNPTDGQQLLLRLENSRTLRLSLFGFPRNEESVIAIRRILSALHASPIRPANWEDPIKEKEHLQKKKEVAIANVDQLLTRLETGIKKRKERMETAIAVRNAAVDQEINRVDETCNLIRILGPQPKKSRTVANCSEEGNLTPRVGKTIMTGLSENYSTGLGSASGFLETHRDGCSMVNGNPPLATLDPLPTPVEPSPIAIENTSPMSPTAASPDPFRSSPEDEDEPPSRLTEEEECLLLDASMDELMEPSPATFTPDAQEQSNPKKLMVVSGEDWTYDMRDLRTSSCKSTI
jgi:hypothetical protein